MFNRPIVGIAICMTVGIFAGYAAGMPLRFAYISFFVFTLGSLVTWVLEKQVERGITFIFICMSIFFLGITLMQGERQSLLNQARVLGIELPGSQDKIEAKKGMSEVEKESSGSGWHSSARSRRFQYLSIRGVICAFPEERSVYFTEPGGEEEDDIEAASDGNAISDNAPETSARISNRMKKISFLLKIEEVKKKDKWKKMDGKIQVNVYETVGKDLWLVIANGVKQSLSGQEIASPTASFGLAMTKGDDSNDTERKFRIGDRLEINGHLQPLPGPRNPGDFDYGAYLLRKRIVGQMRLVRDKTPKMSALPSAGISNGVSIRTQREEGRVSGEPGSGSERKGEENGGEKQETVPVSLYLLSRNNINFITRIAARGRDYMEKIIDLGPYDEGRGVLLKAMLIGKREGMDERIKENFINTGTIHIMAISGLHLVIVMAIILFICKIILLPERAASIVCIAFLILYAFLTGGRSSVLRATIMAVLFLGGKFFIRQVDKWTALSLAGIIILSVSPQALFDSGFQLTFMAVAGLMYFYPPMENLFRERFKTVFNRALSRYFVKAFLAVLVAQLALGPFLIYYYYRFPLITFIANLIVVPLLGIITVLGFVSSLAGFVSLSLASAFNATNNIFLLIMEKTAGFLGNLSGQIIYLARPHPMVFLFYYTSLFLAFYSIKKNFLLQTGKK